MTTNYQDAAVQLASINSSTLDNKARLQRVEDLANDVKPDLQQESECIQRAVRQAGQVTTKSVMVARDDVLKAILSRDHGVLLRRIDGDITLLHLPRDRLIQQVLAQIILSHEALS